MEAPSEKTVKDVDFGRIDAENDHGLDKYFVDTGVFDRLAAGEKSLVVGRKGSGKTAIFKTASESRIGVPTLKLDFEDYSWPVHLQIREEGVPEEAAYVASWKFTFLANICKYWMSNAPEPIAKQAMESIAMIFGGEDPGTLQLLFDKFRRLRKISIPTPVGGAGVELDEAAPASGPVVAQTLSFWNQRLSEFIAGNFAEAPICVLADRVDEGWDASEGSKMLLAGLLKAARSVNNACHKPHHPAPVVVFLRSDLFDQLQFNDKNKMQGVTEWLRWDREELVDVVSARVASSLGGERESAWESVFITDELRQRASVQSYIAKRTMARPRDMISFCGFCRDAAVKAGHKIVERDDIYAAERAYSKYLYDELDDETHKQVPEFRDLLQTLRFVDKHRFNGVDWKRAAAKQFPGSAPEENEERLRTLFEYSVVGVQRTGGRGGGSQFVFLYDDPLLEPNFDNDMVVHPGLVRHLNIKETRTPTKTSSDDRL